MVYYDEPKLASVLGNDQAREYAVLNKDSIDRSITISVKEGSLLPKDELSKANQAIDLATAGIIDPITALDRLNFPDPMATAERAYVYKAAPQLLFQDAGMQVQNEMMNQQMQQAAMAQTMTPQEGISPQQLIGEPQLEQPII
jgi:hypothetical protein